MSQNTPENKKHAAADEITFVSERPDSRLSRWLDYIGIGLFVLLLILGTVQVLVRFVTAPYLGYNIAWTGEAARFVLIYTTMFGSLVAARDLDHIRIEVLLKRIPQQLEKPFKFIVHVAALAFLVFAAYGSYLATLSNVDVAPGAVPYVTMGHIYAVLVVGFVGMAAYELRWLIVDLGLLQDHRGETDE